MAYDRLSYEQIPDRDKTIRNYQQWLDKARAGWRETKAEASALRAQVSDLELERDTLQTLFDGQGSHVHNQAAEIERLKAIITDGLKYSSEVDTNNTILRAQADRLKSAEKIIEYADQVSDAFPFSDRDLPDCVQELNQAIHNWRAAGKGSDT